MIIAVDGPVAAGKGTLARRLAAALDYAYLDTGSIYRAVAAKSLIAGGDPEDPRAAAAAARALTPIDLERDDLRLESVSQAASKVAAIPEVRAALLDFQRAFARRSGGAVLDGRDIGTVICPWAQVKLFVTASAEVRAQRRLDELLGRGIDAEFSVVLQDVKTRDARDAERAAAPMVAAEDAVQLDTSTMDVDAAVASAVAAVEARFGG